MNTTHRVAILVLGFNHRKYLNDALGSASRQKYPATYLTIYYIDNASQDGSYDYVKENFPHIISILHSKNLGYAGAYALALEDVFRQGFDTALLLNPDTLMHEDCVEELVHSAYRSSRIAFVQPKIYLWPRGSSNIFNSFGNKINFLGFGYCGRYKEEDLPLVQTDEEIAFASGAALLVKKEVYEKLPGLDISFFAYLEDQDLGWQARFLGYISIVSARATIWHKYDFRKKHLNNFKFYLLERNRLTFLLKYFQKRTLCLIFPALIIMECGILGVALFNGYFLDKLRGYQYNLSNIRDIMAKRRSLQRIRTKSDKELFQYLSPDINFIEVQSLLLSLVNFFLRTYYKIVQKIL